MEQTRYAVFDGPRLDQYDPGSLESPLKPVAPGCLEGVVVMNFSLIGITVLSASCFVHEAHADCYTVYSANGGVTYRSTVSPVDLSRPLGETIPGRFGSGTSMVIANDETGCIQVALAAGAPPEGISRSEARAHIAKGRADAAPNHSQTGAPASLDGVFSDQSMQMRSSVGVTDPTPAATATVQRPERR
jgi:hypothetical protein